jgi:hypothetical protein
VSIMTLCISSSGEDLSETERFRSGPPTMCENYLDVVSDRSEDSDLVYVQFWAHATHLRLRPGLDDRPDD